MRQGHPLPGDRVAYDVGGGDAIAAGWCTAEQEEEPIATVQQLYLLAR